MEDESGIRQIPAVAGDIYRQDDGEHTLIFRHRPWHPEARRWVVELVLGDDRDIWTETVARGVGPSRVEAEADLCRNLRAQIRMAS